MRTCPRAIIAIICHGGAVGPSLRTEADAAVVRAGMASPGAVPAGTITGSVGSDAWAAMVSWTRSHSARALTRRIQSRTVSVGMPSSAPILWGLWPPAQRTCRGRSHTRPPSEERSERVRAKPQRRSRPGRSGHLSSGPQDRPAPGRVPRARLALSRIGPSSLTGRPAGEGPVVLNPGPWDQRNASHRITGLKAFERPETGVITHMTRWTPHATDRGRAGHRHQQ